MSTRPLKLRARAAGFTLIEILVALLILAIMSGLGYATYRAARISAERTEDSLKRSREIEFGMRMMVQDFAEMVPRPVRDILGPSRLPALRGTPGAGTRDAPPRPARLPTPAPAPVRLRHELQLGRSFNPAEFQFQLGSSGFDDDRPERGLASSI